MKRVIISNRALAAMVSGIERYPDTENGGILLGIKKGELFTIIESIEAGSEAVRERGKLSFNSKTIEHTLLSVVDLYEEELSMVGVWHKHLNECNPPFSEEDSRCHKSLSDRLKKDIISILFQKLENDEYLMRVYCYKNGMISEVEYEIEVLEKLLKYKTNF